MPTSLFAGRKLAQKVKELFGDAQIEDLWPPFFCISSNLSRAQIAIHRHGSFARPLTMPNIGAILMRAGELAIIANQQEIEKTVDLYLRLPVIQYQLHDYKFT